MIEHAGRAVCAMALRDGVSAQAAFAELLAAFPDAPNVHYLYGQYLSANDHDAALREYRKELARNPKHAEVLATIALEYEARADLDTATSYARRSVEADGQFFGAHAVLGKLLVSTGHGEEAIKELEIARRQAPDSPQVHFLLATAYFVAGKKRKRRSERAEFARLEKIGSIETGQ